MDEFCDLCDTLATPLRRGGCRRYSSIIPTLLEQKGNFATPQSFFYFFSAKKNFLPMQAGDVPESFADIEKSNKMLDFKPTTNVDIGISNFIRWYRKYNKC